MSLDITVNLLGKREGEHVISVNPTSSMESIKHRMAELLGESVDSMTLVFKGRILNNDDSITSQDIKSGDKIILILRDPTIKIKVVDGKTYEILFKSTYLVESVKQTMAEILGTSIEKIKLVYSGRELENKKLLSEYGIKKDDKLHLVFKQTEVGIITQGSTTRQRAYEALEAPKNGNGNEGFGSKKTPKKNGFSRRIRANRKRTRRRSSYSR